MINEMNCCKRLSFYVSLFLGFPGLLFLLIVIKIVCFTSFSENSKRKIYIQFSLKQAPKEQVKTACVICLFPVTIH